MIRGRGWDEGGRERGKEEEKGYIYCTVCRETVDAMQAQIGKKIYESTLR